MSNSCSSTVTPGRSILLELYSQPSVGVGTLGGGFCSIYLYTHTRGQQLLFVPCCLVVLAPAVLLTHMPLSLILLSRILLSLILLSRILLSLVLLSPMLLSPMLLPLMLLPLVLLSLVLLSLITIMSVQ